MTSVEFQAKLAEAFKTRMFASKRDHHTVNELMYVLEHDSAFNGEEFNISICTVQDTWRCIPCLYAFVDIKTRGVWFNDAEVEFEVEEFDEENYNCVTVYERKKEE